MSEPKKNTSLKIKKLTKKQESFCQEYIVDLNATQAAIRAGYSEKTAREQAARLLSNVNIQERIAQLMEKRAEKVGVEAAEVLQRLANIMRFDFREIVDENNMMRNLADLSPELTQCIQEYSEVEISGKFGTKVTRKLKIPSRLDAIEKIGRHIGFFEKDNKQQATSVTIVANDNDEAKALGSIIGGENDK